jgi:ribose 5-phosphate isomerase B
MTWPRQSVENLVREALLRDLRQRGESVADASAPCEPELLDFVSEADIRRHAGCTEIRVRLGAIVTPLARELAQSLGISIEVGQAPALAASSTKLPILLGADHGGFDAKNALKAFLVEEAGQSVIDCGCNSKDPVDYPDIAHEVARRLAKGEARFGVLLDGAGIGSCMAANRHKGVRAAVLRDPEEASHSRRHNNANLACFRGSSDLLLLLKATLLTFLTTEFEGGRHERRVQRIEVR